jgi:short-subunit dehydrogenase
MEDGMTDTKLAVVTGASSGIGRELAKLCAKDGYNLVIAADEPAIRQAAEALESHDGTVEAIEADLATIQGVDRLISQSAIAISTCCFSMRDAGSATASSTRTGEKSAG